MTGNAGLALLPGLYLAAVIGALCWALRRWFDPIPARVLIAYAALLVILFGPALFLGQVLVPLDNLTAMEPFRDLAERPPNPIHGDISFAIVPWQALVRNAYQAGEWPLWNPYSAAGMTLLGNSQSQALQPTTLVGLPLTLERAAVVTGGLRAFLALAFTFLLLQRLGAGPGGALVASLSFGLSGFLLVWLPWPLASSGALLPGLFYAVLRVQEEGGRRDLLLLVLFTFAVAVGGHPETVFLALAMAGLFALARALRRQRGPAPVWRLWPQRALRSARRLLPVAVSMILGGLLAAPALLPAGPAIRASIRHEVVGARAASGVAPATWETAEERREHLRRVAPVVTPHAFGHELRGAFWGYVNTNEVASFFPGTVPLLLGLSLLVPLRGVRRLPGERFFLITALFMVAARAQVPGVPWLLGKVPWLAGHYLGRGSFLFCLAVAALAGFACQRWRQGALARPRVALLALLLGMAVVWGYLAHAPPEGMEPLDSFRLRSAAVQLGGLAAGVVLLVAAAPRRIVVFGLGALVAVELVTFHRPLNASHPPHLFYPQVPVVEFLLENQGQERILGLAPLLPANIPAFYGLRDVRIYDPLEPTAYTRFATPLRHQDFPSRRLWEPLHPLYDLLGVGWVLAPSSEELPEPLTAAFHSPRGRVWRRPGALPPLFFPHAARESDGVEALRGVFREVDFLARAVVTGSPEESPLEDGHWTAGAPDGSVLEITRTTPSHLRAEALLVERRLLATGIYQDGRWHVLADGEPLPPVTTNTLMVGAWLPPWARQIDVLYRPLEHLLGCLLAAVAAGGLLLLVVPPPIVGSYRDVGASGPAAQEESSQ